MRCAVMRNCIQLIGFGEVTDANPWYLPHCLHLNSRGADTTSKQLHPLRPCLQALALLPRGAGMEPRGSKKATLVKRVEHLHNLA